MTITTPEQMREAAAKCCDINNISPNFSAPAQSISTAMAIAAAIRAIPIAPQPADLLSDPRVVALVEAARNMRDYGTCLAEQKYHRDLDAAIRAIGGEA